MPGNEDSLVVLWTSGDKEVALNMVFMYTLNFKLKNGELCLSDYLGSFFKVISEEKDLQDEIQKMKNAGATWKLAKPVQTNMESRSTLNS